MDNGTTELHRCSNHDDCIMWLILTIRGGRHLPFFLFYPAHVAHLHSHDSIRLASPDARFLPNLVCCSV